MLVMLYLEMKCMAFRCDCMVTQLWRAQPFPRVNLYLCTSLVTLVMMSRMRHIPIAICIADVLMMACA